LCFLFCFFVFLCLVVSLFSVASSNPTTGVDWSSSTYLIGWNLRSLSANEQPVTVLMATGRTHTCFISTAPLDPAVKARLFCMGDNYYGALGHGGGTPLPNYGTAADVLLGNPMSALPETETFLDPWVMGWWNWRRAGGGRGLT
jgi:hypothetical protein